jgi:hypothetical protein
MIFSWEFYVNKYPDLYDIKIREDAWAHWSKHGKKEQRIYTDVPILFNWKDYIKNNSDLNKIDNEEEAWKHCLYHLKKENRFTCNGALLKQYCL